MKILQKLILSFALKVMTLIGGELKDTALAYYHAVEGSAKVHPMLWWQKRELFLAMMGAEFADDDRKGDWVLSWILETVHSLIKGGKWKDKVPKEKLRAAVAEKVKNYVEKN